MPAAPQRDEPDDRGGRVQVERERARPAPARARVPRPDRRAARSATGRNTFQIAPDPRRDHQRRAVSRGRGCTSSPLGARSTSFSDSSGRSVEVRGGSTRARSASVPRRGRPSSARASPRAAAGPCVDIVRHPGSRPSSRCRRRRTSRRTNRPAASRRSPFDSSTGFSNRTRLYPTHGPISTSARSRRPRRRAATDRASASPRVRSTSGSAIAGIRIEKLGPAEHRERERATELPGARVRRLLAEPLDRRASRARPRTRPRSPRAAPRRSARGAGTPPRAPPRSARRDRPRAAARAGRRARPSPRRARTTRAGATARSSARRATTPRGTTT